MKASALKADLEIEELESEIRTDLELQHTRDIVKLQGAYGI